MSEVHPKYQIQLYLDHKSLIDLSDHIDNYNYTSRFERPRTFPVPTKNKQTKFQSLPRIF